MELHIGFEAARPYGLKRIDAAIMPKGGKSKKDKSGQLPQFTTLESEEIKTPKTKLKADKAAGIIEIDEATRLEGVPAQAWEYRLGNRSAIEWILEEYKERKPKDPTIAEKFNTYRFADHKETVIDLIGRVCTVSVETMKIIREMEAERKADWWPDRVPRILSGAIRVGLLRSPENGFPPTRERRYSQPRRLCYG